MTDRVFLPADVARCSPLHRCVRKATCARFLAPIPAHGGVVADFTQGSHAASATGGTWLCLNYIDAANCRDRVAAPVTIVKPAIKGIAG